MLIYAATSDYTAYAGTAPANIASLLRSASLLVRRETRTARYDVDTTGMPTDATVLAAFKDATCAQAASWAAAGVDPTAGGLQTASTVRAKGIGSARIEYDTSLSQTVTALTVRQDIAETLCPDAVQILTDALDNLGRPWTYG